MRKTVKSVFQEDACYVIWMLRKLYISMLNLSQAMQGPAESIFKESMKFKDEIHIRNLLKTSE